MPPLGSIDKSRCSLSLADTRVTEALGRALALSMPRIASAPNAAPEPNATPVDVESSGAVLNLHGELGAGKTTCVRSLLRALGVAGLVRSPTYTLVETYPVGALTCVHVDLYRLQSLTEVDELGLRDLSGPGYLLLVEWPEKGGGALPPADMDLTLRYAGDARQAGVIARTPLGFQWLENLGQDSSLSPYVSNLT
jgi:tRNA threonylcarbamoyladenosine biosynthesis protein TsaE